MIALMLLDALVVHLQELFKGYSLSGKDGKAKAVKVFPQFLPQPRGVTLKPRGGKGDDDDGGQEYGPADIESNFPCIIVKLDEGRDKEENASDATLIDVRILVGTYHASPDCQGYRDVLNILERIRQDLLTSRYLERRYRLEMPFKWYLFEDQPWPIFFGQIETVWETGRPQLPPHFDTLGKG